MASDTSVMRVTDDNLVTRRRNVTKGIEEIRAKKSEIAQALRDVGQDVENEDKKSLIKQLVEAFDGLTTQENQYLEILQAIVGIHEQATKDIAEDYEQKIAADEEKLRLIRESQADGASDAPADEADGDPDVQELREALLELRKVSDAAVAASELNDKLVERLQLHKKKKSAMMELRTKKAKELDETAKQVRAEVTEKMRRLATEKSTTIQKEKELEELRKQCLRLGIQLGQEEEQKKEETIKAASSVMNGNQRIPPISKEEAAQQSEEQLEEKRKQIRENIRKERERKEEVNAIIREKLAAMEARKKRIIEIRGMLQDNAAKQTQLTSGGTTGEENASSGSTEQPAAEENEQVEEINLDEIITNAKANLQNLTAMRERLQEMQTNGGPLSADDVELIENLERQRLNEEMDENAAVDEIEQQVRLSFANATDAMDAVRAESRRLLVQLYSELPTRRAATPSQLSPLLALHQRLITTPADLKRALGQALISLADDPTNGDQLLPLLLKLYAEVVQQTTVEGNRRGFFIVSLTRTDDGSSVWRAVVAAKYRVSGGCNATVHGALLGS
ncbi:unnamed protein product [Caenorhabditis auriculariae]|uniref:Uncharacterized protein n=1 Tax=Caenorhabditis auriculariae TaxID=2777116 RepID=A0A8S1GZ34_9PELO|nr:unnamed protein product [Caenorhabditis auriculariae]